MQSKNCTVWDKLTHRYIKNFDSLPEKKYKIQKLYLLEIKNIIGVLYTLINELELN